MQSDGGLQGLMASLGGSLMALNAAFSPTDPRIQPYIRQARDEMVALRMKVLVDNGMNPEVARVQTEAAITTDRRVMLDYQIFLRRNHLDNFMQKYMQSLTPVATDLESSPTVTQRKDALEKQLASIAEGPPTPQSDPPPSPKTPAAPSNQQPIPALAIGTADANLGVAPQTNPKKLQRLLENISSVVASKVAVGAGASERDRNLLYASSQPGPFQQSASRSQSNKTQLPNQTQNAPSTSEQRAKRVKAAQVEFENAMRVWRYHVFADHQRPPVGIDPTEWRLRLNAFVERRALQGRDAFAQQERLVATGFKGPNGTADLPSWLRQKRVPTVEQILCETGASEAEVLASAQICDKEAVSNAVHRPAPSGTLSPISSDGSDLRANGHHRKRGRPTGSHGFAPMPANAFHSSNLSDKFFGAEVEAQKRAEKRDSDERSSMSASSRSSSVDSKHDNSNRHAIIPPVSASIATGYPTMNPDDNRLAAGRFVDLFSSQLNQQAQGGNADPYGLRDSGFRDSYGQQLFQSSTIQPRTNVQEVNWSLATGDAWQNSTATYPASKMVAASKLKKKGAQTKRARKGQQNPTDYTPFMLDVSGVNAVEAGARRGINMSEAVATSARFSRWGVGEEESKRLDRMRRFKSGMDGSLSTPVVTTKVSPSETACAVADSFLVGKSTALEKQYLRLCGPPDPAQIRPEAVLHRSFEHCMRRWKTEKKYSFIEEQFRSIRQDLTVQGIRNGFTVQIYETNARLALQNADLGQFNQCQTQLREFHKSVGGHEPTSREEFLCYRLIYLALMNMTHDLLIFSTELTEEEKNLPAVQFAQVFRKAIADANYYRALTLRSRAPFLSKLLIDLFLNRLRMAYLCIICRGHYTIDVSFVTNVLRFSNSNECEAFLCLDNAAIWVEKPGCQQTHQPKRNDNNTASRVLDCRKSLPNYEASSLLRTRKIKALG